LGAPVLVKRRTGGCWSTLRSGRARKYLQRLDSAGRERVAGSLEITASDYVTMVRRCAQLSAAATERMRGFDAWITPTSPTLPTAVSECTTVQAAVAWNKRALRNTRPANVFSM